MAYTLNFSLFDLAGFYSAGFPVLTGTISNPALVGGGGTVFDTVTSKTPTLLTLPFPSSSVPPAPPTACAVLVTDTTVPGDFLRSGVLTALPASPATATAITVPTIPISSALVASAALGAAIPPTVVPGWIRWLSGLLTGGQSIPLVAVLPPPIVTLGTGTLSLIVTGVLTVRVFFFSVRTVAFTLTTTVTAAPSGDAETPSRVLSVSATTASLALTAGPTPPGLGQYLSQVLASVAESTVNSVIVSLGISQAAKMGFQLTPTAVFCARRVTVLPSGIALQLVLSDLWGPAIVPIPGVLAASIAPNPRLGVLETYTITVVNSATGSPVPMATVTLHDYDANGALVSVARTTNAAGQATFNVNLHTKTTTSYITSTYVGTDGKPHREPEKVQLTLNPYFTVDAAGFTSIRVSLS